MLLYDRLMLDQMAHLTSEHERLRLMFEQAPGFMALLEGPDHRIAVANDAFADLVGKAAHIRTVPVHGDVVSTGRNMGISFGD